MDYERPDQAAEDYVSSAFDGVSSRVDAWADADDYLLNDIGVAMRLNSERG
jgi:hypothetical protein